MRQPSVKGELLEPVLDELRERLEAGALGRERIEVTLEPADLALLDEKIRPARWYPMGGYGRVVELLAESSGAGRSEALLERGSRAARALLAEAGGGSLEALRDALAGDADAAAAWIAGTVLRHAARQQSCVRWTWRAGAPGTGSYRIELHEAAPLPDCVRILTEVVLRQLHAELDPAGREVTSERVEPDRIVLQVG